ncbi:MAG TPA: DUF177 domain-containing protein [Candidatus Tumulicola sp.]|nr:DUF177 domain-containing protein [Candidatus Tumulicola sp.]
MKISVERLFGPHPDTIEVDQALRLQGDLATRYPRGVHIVANISHITRGAYVEGRIEGREEETCVRCLEPFERHTRVTIEEAYSEEIAPAEAQFSEVSPLVERAIDVGELVTQLLEVDEPLAAICSESCRGICPTCGINRNRDQCACSEHVIDERLAGLAKFMEEPGVN